MGAVVAERYRVTGVLGAGATGTVYAVEHTRLGRRLAMKVLHPALARAQDLTQRFEREAVAIARLDHAHVVGAIDFGQCEQAGWYLVTERIDGQPLNAALRAHPEWTGPVFTQLLDALQHAHMQGILHRDLKPDNVLVSERHGQPFVTVLDFGLAKVLFDSDELITQQGAVFGTPRYMSPEQAGGEPATSASDLYAVGVMLFEVLEGRPPFEGGSVAEILTKHITSDLPPLSPDTKVAETLIQRALSKAPSERYPDARAFSEAMQGALPNGSGPTVPAPVSPRQSAETVRPEPAQRLGGALERGGARAWLVLAPAVVIGLALTLGTLLSKDALDDARAHLDAGRLDAASAVLDGVLAEPGAHAQAQLLRGHVAVARQQWAQAIEAYQLALAADPDLADDERLGQAVPVIVDKDRKRGAELVKWLAENGTDDAAELLAGVAQQASRSGVRRRAYEGLERLEETDRLPVVSYLSAELRRARDEGCRSRRWYVERLLATEDEAAVQTGRDEARRKDPLLGLIPQSSCMKDLLRDLPPP